MLIFIKIQNISFTILLVISEMRRITMKQLQGEQSRTFLKISLKNSRISSKMLEIFLETLSVAENLD